MPKFTDSMMEENCLIKSDNEDKCVVCGQLTQYVDSDDKVRLCSTECKEEFYARLFKAIFNSNY